MSDDDALVDELAREILDYLAAHPQAADGLDGIVQWWIVHQRFVRGVEATAKALDRLVAEGRIERVIGPDGTVLFRAPGARGDGDNGDPP
jgi:hypothetical protein